MQHLRASEAQARPIQGARLHPERIARVPRPSRYRFAFRAARGRVARVSARAGWRKREEPAELRGRAVADGRKSGRGSRIAGGWPTARYRFAARPLTLDWLTPARVVRVGAHPRSFSGIPVDYFPRLATQIGGKRLSVETYEHVRDGIGGIADWQLLSSVELSLSQYYRAESGMCGGSSGSSLYAGRNNCTLPWFWRILMINRSLQAW